METKFTFEEISGFTEQDEFEVWIKDRLLANLSSFQVKRLYEIVYDMFSQKPPLSVALVQETVGCIAHIVESDVDIANVLLNRISERGKLESEPTTTDGSRIITFSGASDDLVSVDGEEYNIYETTSFSVLAPNGDGLYVVAIYDGFWSFAVRQMPLPSDRYSDVGMDIPEWPMRIGVADTKYSTALHIHVPAGTVVSIVE